MHPVTDRFGNTRYEFIDSPRWRLPPPPPRDEPEFELSDEGGDY